MLTGNKLRLYLGYWIRQPSPAHPEKYHVGLILSPKNPKNHEKRAMLYHATNPIDGVTLVETWNFEPRETEPRTARLVGCILLGKVPPKFKVESITELLRKVNVPSPEEAQAKNWRCHHWVLDALVILQAEGVIPELPSSPDEVLQIGNGFVEGMTNGNPVHGEPLYTCDTSGKGIVSEFPLFNVN